MAFRDSFLLDALDRFRFGELFGDRFGWARRDSVSKVLCQSGLRPGGAEEGLTDCRHVVDVLSLAIPPGSAPQFDSVRRSQAAARSAGTSRRRRRGTSGCRVEKVEVRSGL